MRVQRVKVKGWDYVWAALAGALLFVSFPKLDLWPAAWFFLVPLLLCLRGKSWRDAFVLGTFSGAVAYLGIVYWVIVAVHRYGEMPLLLAVPVLLLLVIYLSLYWGAFAAFASCAMEIGGLVTLFSLPAVWVGLEYLRNFLLSGFPWALVGYSQYLNTQIVQIADLTGVYGVSFLIILVNTLVFLWVSALRREERIPLVGTVLVIAAVGGSLVYGNARMRAPFDVGKGLLVGVAQGNIPQDVKWDSAFQNKTLAIYRALSLQLKGGAPDLLVWPETAIPFYFPSGTVMDGAILDIARETGAYLLVGSLSMQREKRRVNVYNSAYLISPQRRIVDRYDKLHLVPFGEYVPLSEHLPILNRMVDIGNIATGKKQVIFRLPRGGFGVLICFEVIFPELCRGYVKDGASFIVTITNDAWFGKTSAPYQHLYHAAFRAIENRRWMVRAANTGVSAFIDPWGRIRQQSGIFTEAALLHEIRCRTGTVTFYTRYGDLFARVCSALAVFLICYCLIRRLLI